MVYKLFVVEPKSCLVYHLILVTSKNINVMMAVAKVDPVELDKGVWWNFIKKRRGNGIN